MEKLAATEHSSHVTVAFDNVASDYDSFETLDGTQLLRSRVYAIIDSLMPDGSRILDINCGTGTDAINLALRGYNVTATDLSPRMIEQAHAKATEKNVRVRFRVASFAELSPLADESFDLVLSNFGGLNCVQDLASVAASIQSVIQQRGYFIAVVMPRFSMWETLAGLSHLNFSLAIRRWKGRAVASSFNENGFDVFYHSLRSLKQAFLPSLDLREITGFDIVSPPPHAAQFATRHQKMTQLLRSIDKKIDSLPILRMMGDHVMLVFQRRA